MMSHFLDSPSTNILSLFFPSPPFCLYESAPPPTNTLLPHCSILSYAGASSLPWTKGLPSRCCQASPSSATYVSGNINPSRYTPLLVVHTLGKLSVQASQWSCNPPQLLQFFTRLPECSLTVVSMHAHLHRSIAGWISSETTV